VFTVRSGWRVELGAVPLVSTLLVADDEASVTPLRLRIDGRSLRAPP
jgi:hypothetical protein